MTATLEVGANVRAFRRWEQLTQVQLAERLDISAEGAGFDPATIADPLLEEHSVTTNDVRELAESPAAARAVIALFHAYKSSVQSTRDLASQLYDGGVLQGIDPVHLPSEEASDVIQ